MDHYNDFEANAHAEMAAIQREMDALDEQERLFSLQMHSVMMQGVYYVYPYPYPDFYDRRRFLMHQLYLIHASLVGQEQYQADTANRLRIEAWVEDSTRVMNDPRNWEYQLAGEKIMRRILMYKETIDLMISIFQRHKQGITDRATFEEESKQLTTAEWASFIEMLKNIYIANLPRNRFYYLPCFQQQK